MSDPEARDHYPATVRLYLVRHAEATPGTPDELRPLTEAGRRAARELGRRLAGEGPLDAVVTSPLLRARETAAVIARVAGVGAPAVEEGLAPGATTQSVLAAVQGRGERVVAVAHQPDCARVAEALLGEKRLFPPGGMAVIEIAADR